MPDIYKIVKRFKYHFEMKILLDMGIELPVSLLIPNKLDAYRWVFADDSSRNHLPVYIQQPQRIINKQHKNQLNTSG